MNKEELRFFSKEKALLDDLYREKVKVWQELRDLYDLKFERKIRDLEDAELVKVSRFYPLVRKIVAGTAFNYPKLYFAVEDEGADGVSTLLERAAQAWMSQANVKPHVHQAIVDSLFTGCGWLRLDYNPPGDDMVPPYVTNDAKSEDLVVVNRVDPGMVHLDPLCPPHDIGQARYIRERVMIPRKFLLEDKRVKHKAEIKALKPSNDSGDFQFGMPDTQFGDRGTREAQRQAINNGSFLWADVWHMREDRKLVMFVDGIKEPVIDERHPWANVAFEPRRSFISGEPLVKPDGRPVYDLDNGVEQPGWLVENGFGFVPVKTDLHPERFDPLGQLKYIEDIQYSIVTSLSRQNAMLRRTARQGLIARREVEEDAELPTKLKSGVDGEWHVVEDPNTAARELSYGSVPFEQYNLEDRAKNYEEEITNVAEFQNLSGETTATHASLVASDASLNQKWLEAAVSQVYELLVRDAFQIMGNPRYTPENFVQNVAADGSERLNRALESADFLWNYRITARTGSMQPLFDQIQHQDLLSFYDRAVGNPNFDQVQISRMLAGAYVDVDIEKVMSDGINEEAEQAARLEHQLIFQGNPPPVTPNQDHQAHVQVHSDYQNDPAFQQMMLAAQATDMQGLPVNPQMAAQIRQIEQMMLQHVEEHQAAQEAADAAVMAPPGNSPPQPELTSQVRSNAQDVQNAVN